MPYEAPPQTTTAPRELWAIARDLISDLFNLFGEPQDIARELGVTRAARALMLTWLRACETVLRHLLLIEARALAPSLALSPRAASADPSQRRATPFDADAPETWRVSFRALPQRATYNTARASTPRPPVDRDAKRAANMFKDPAQTLAAQSAKAAWLAQMNATSAARTSSPTCGGSAEQSEAKGDVVEHTPNAPLRLAASPRSTSPAGGGGLYSTLPLARRAEAILRAFNTPIRYARRIALRLARQPKDAPRLLHIPDDIDRAVDRGSVMRLHSAAASRRPPSDSS